MSIRALTLSAVLAIAFAAPALAEEDGVVDTPQDVQSTSEAATDPGISDESSSYLSSGGFDSGTDTAGSDDDGSDLQPAPMTVSPNE